MRWGSASSRRARLDEAIGEVVHALRARFDGASVDLLLVFATPHHGLGWAELPGRLRAAFPGARLVGTSASGVIGDGDEIEGEAGLVVVAASLPDVDVRAFHLPRSRVIGPEGPDDDDLDAVLELDPDAAGGVVVLADPFSCNVSGLLTALARRHPRLVPVGGLASASDEPGRNGLFIDDDLVTDGVVGVALAGAVTLTAVVGQGCRPAGVVHRVTAVEGPLLLELDGEPALPLFHRTFQGLPPETKRLFQTRPMVGVSTDPADERAPWLARPIAGVNGPRQGLVLGHPLAVGDRVRFQARDPAAAIEELQEQLAREARVAGPPEAVLAFSCVGRGSRFYRREAVDSRLVREVLGPVPIGGFFGLGEVGPVRGRAWLHGLTSVLALVRAPGWD